MAHAHQHQGFVGDIVVNHGGHRSRRLRVIEFALRSCTFRVQSVRWRSLANSPAAGCMRDRWGQRLQHRSGVPAIGENGFTPALGSAVIESPPGSCRNSREHPAVIGRCRSDGVRRDGGRSHGSGIRAVIPCGGHHHYAETAGRFHRLALTGRRREGSGHHTRG